MNTEVAVTSAPADFNYSDDIKLIRLEDVMRMTGLSKSTIYEMIRIEDFPSPVKIGKRCAAWVETEIKAWIISRINKSRS